MQTRRNVLLTIAGTAAAAPMLGQEAGHVMAAEGPAAALTYEPVFFKQADYAVVSRLADLIIPRTDTPGALDAHVPYRIDREVSLSTGLQEHFSEGLASLPPNFISMSEAQQVAAVESISDGVFFRVMKGLTVEWYYKSEEGLVKELGFHSNTYRTEFPGCNHPEHFPQETK